VLLQASNTTTLTTTTTSDELIDWLWEPLLELQQQQQHYFQLRQPQQQSPPQQQSHPQQQNVLIVVDDLHLLERPSDDHDNHHLPWELRTVQIALTQWLERILRPTTPTSSSQPYSQSLFPTHHHHVVLGVTRNPHQLAASFTQNTAMLDWHLEVPAPRRGQRREILQALLRQLPLQLPEQQQQEQREQEQPPEQPPEHHHHQQRQQQQQQAARWAEWLADHTAGCVAADLVRLCETAQLQAQARQRSILDQKNSQINNDSHDNDNDKNNNTDNGDHHNNEASSAAGIVVTWKNLVEATQALVPSQWEALDVIPPPRSSLLLSAMTTQDDDNTLDKGFGNEDAFVVDHKPPPPYAAWYRQHQRSWEAFAGYTTMKRRLYRTVVLPWRKWLQEQNDKDDSTLEDVIVSATTTTTTQVTAPFPPPRGVIFHGPSGCGKTLAASYLGASLNLPMIRCRAADVLDKWLGGSEAALRLFFQKARNAAPCILFLDDLDAIATNRQTAADVGDAAGSVMSRLLSTLLNEMDGVSSSVDAGVLVVACTNRMDRLDAALLRPGRLEEHVEISLPTVEDATRILQYYFSRRKNESTSDCSTTVDEVDPMSHRELFVSPDVRLEELANDIVSKHHATGATMEGIAREAVLRCIRGQAMDLHDAGNAEHLPQVSHENVQDALEALFLV